MSSPSAGFTLVPYTMEEADTETMGLIGGVGLRVYFEFLEEFRKLFIFLAIRPPPGSLTPRARPPPSQSLLSAWHTRPRFFVKRPVWRCFGHTALGARGAWSRPSLPALPSARRVFGRHAPQAILSMPNVILNYTSDGLARCWAPRAARGGGGGGAPRRATPPQQPVQQRRAPRHCLHAERSCLDREL